MSLPARLSVGDVVLWRGTWGRDDAVRAVVTALEETDAPHAKYGRPVPSLDWSRVTADYAVVTLHNGSWAYGSQLAPLPFVDFVDPRRPSEVL